MQKTTRMLSLLAVVVSFALLAPGTAAAGDDGEVAFEQLEVSTTDADQLRIEYVVVDEDWQKLQRDGVHPELNIYTKSDRGDGLKFAYNFDLQSRGGSFTLPSEIEGHHLEQVQLEVLGFAETWRVDRLSYHGASGARLVFTPGRDGFSHAAIGAGECRAAAGEVDYESRETREESDREDDSGESDSEKRSSKWKAGVIAACDDAMYSESDRETCTRHAFELEADAAVATIETCDDVSHDSDDIADCLEHAREYRAEDPTGIIEACDDVTADSSGRTSCLKHGAELREEWAVRALEGCDDAFSFGDEINRCAETIAEYEQVDPAPAIEACDDLSTSQSTTLECLRAGAGYSTDPTPTIEACESAAYDQSDQVACVEHAAKLGEGGADVVEACSGDSLTSCIDRAAP